MSDLDFSTMAVAPSTPTGVVIHEAQEVADMAGRRARALARWSETRGWMVPHRLPGGIEVLIVFPRLAQMADVLDVLESMGSPAVQWPPVPKQVLVTPE